MSHVILNIMPSILILPPLRRCSQSQINAWRLTPLLQLFHSQAAAAQGMVHADSGNVSNHCAPDTCTGRVDTSHTLTLACSLRNGTIPAATVLFFQCFMLLASTTSLASLFHRLSPCVMDANSVDAVIIPMAS